MGKRTERFSGKSLQNKLSGFDGQEVQVVLWNGHTYMGDVVFSDQKSIKLQDKNARWYNRKKHIHYFELDAIHEIIVDKKSKW